MDNLIVGLAAGCALINIVLVSVMLGGLLNAL